MYNTNTTLHFVGKCMLLSGVALLFMSFFSAMTFEAQAHTDPGGCNATGVNLSLKVYEADGVTPLGAGTVSEGETIKYEATLAHAGGSNCNYEGGTLSITTPDGDVTDVTGGVIPLVSAGNPFVSSQVSYVATAADVGGDGDLDGLATYSNGTSHLGINDVTPVGATAPASTPFVVALEIEKTVSTSFDREWNWTIDKSADQTSLNLDGEQTVTVNYEVALDATSEDTNHTATGTITITNPEDNPDATITGVTDELDNSGALTVDCTGDVTFEGFPHTLAGGESLTCTYSGASDGTDSENTATVDTEGDVPGGSDTVDVVFGDPANEIDECVTVNDTNSNFPADTVVCADDEDKTIEYSVDFGPEGADVVVACGEGTHPNTADFVTNDTQAVGDDDETVAWTVECDLSCTYTQGYWKTHNDLAKGGAPSDETWELLPNGEETIFFLSGKNWVTIFNTPPKGNAYYILAHQYMAAELNALSGASVPSEVQDALDDAEAFFSANAPTATISKTLKAELTALAGTLGSYNEGAIGPGHCD